MKGWVFSVYKVLVGFQVLTELVTAKCAENESIFRISFYKDTNNYDCAGFLLLVRRRKEEK